MLSGGSVPCRLGAARRATSRLSQITIAIMYKGTSVRCNEVLFLNGAQKYYGDLGVDYWNRERWAKEFAEAQVMVMTAQVFYDLLSHAHWSVDKVGLNFHV